MRVAEMCRNKTTIALVVVIVVLCWVLLFKSFRRPEERMFFVNDNFQIEKDDVTKKNDNFQIEKDDVTNMLIAQRNNVSRALNLKQQKLGQLECEKLQGKPGATSETGGWCKQTSKEDSGEHKTDKKLVPVLIDFFQGKYVASFGDGPGRYKQLLSDSGKLIGYDAYDGAPYCDITSEGRVRFLDLTLPQYGLPLYDWVMSLEVAEHIPAEFQSVYVDNIIRHAKEGILLSWARPGQGGYQHINERPFEYVVNLLDTLGFSHDKDTSERLRNAAEFSWLRNNVNVYRRKAPYSDTFSKSPEVYI
ncbi:uncharacterized protein LOC127851634 [Dreissena polymorpha]|uniref:Uncharacterized protein n=1 Tax=Dreissena polymorpha TaxID=45954 RepID=A0A9D4D8G1_DREPO|nr:uncharacterized protein LOC127851634 [Dreissena polymorpha]KAH3739776.1 hypothetical protein DPMN_046463 [Dreissena polymorpha]